MWPWKQGSPVRGLCHYPAYAPPPNHQQHSLADLPNAVRYNPHSSGIPVRPPAAVLVSGVIHPLPAALRREWGYGFIGSASLDCWLLYHR